MNLSSNQNSRGAVIAEVALGMIVLLLGAFFLIYIGLLFHYKRTLTSSMGKALRLAATRSDPSAVGAPTIGPITDLVNYRDYYVARVNDLFSHDVNWSDAIDTYRNSTILSAGSGAVDLYDLPETYLYSLVYMNEGMKLSLGPQALRYPCDPNAKSEKGAGCLLCKFKDPAERRQRDSARATSKDLDDDTFPSLPIDMSCEFQPKLFLLKPAFNLIGVLLGESAVPKILIKRELSFS